MSHPHFHAKSSVKAFGGKPEDYIEIHNFLDSSKAHLADARHRAILHSSFGCFIAEKVFGLTIKNSDGKDVPVRAICEKHILEDLGHIPTVSDWLKNMPIEEWMYKKSKNLSRELDAPQKEDIVEKPKRPIRSPRPIILPPRNPNEGVFVD
jgi:hypothetical protein